MFQLVSRGNVYTDLKMTDSNVGRGTVFPEMKSFHSIAFFYR